MTDTSSSYSFRAEQLLSDALRRPELSESSLGAAIAQALATLQLAQEVHQLRLGDSAEVTLTVYEARSGFGNVRLGTYRSRDAARAHCLAAARDAADVGPDEALHWSSEPDSDIDELRSTYTNRHPFLGYSVVPVEVQAAYDPDREG